MIDFYCTKCKYRFKRNIAPVKCPYCNAEGTIRSPEKMQDILDELDTM